MSGYRRVNYYELCRLCTSSEGNKIHIFREEGRKRQLPTKIQACLSLQLREDDSLPKNICAHCEEKLESLYSFKETCLNAGKMLTTFFSTIRFSDDFLKDGMVYIRDTEANKPPAEQSSEVEGHSAVDASLDTGKTTIANQSPSSEVNHVSSTTNKVAAVTKKQAISSTNNNYSFREQIIEEHNVPLSRDIVHNAPSQVVEVNSSYASFSNGNLINGNNTNLKRESPLNNNHVINQPHDKSQIGFQSPSEMHLKKEPDENGGHLFYINKKKKKIVVNLASGNVTDALQPDIAYQHNQEFRLQLAMANDVKESATSFVTEEVMNRSSEAQLGEFTYLNLKTENSMSPLAEVNGDSSMQLPDCEMSDRDFGSNEELALHMVNYEGAADSENPDSVIASGKRRDVACPICSKVFRRKEHLHQHMKLHTGERPYSCTVCEKSFSRKEHLIRHSVSHTGEKTHTCDICDKTFSRKDNLHKHKKTHGIAGPYVCEECGKSFVIKHYYLMHQTMHAAAADDPSLFRCDICGKVFATKQYLNSHKGRHDKKQRKKEKAAVTETATNETSTSSPIDPSAPPPLTTINAQAILPSNILQVAAPPPPPTNMATYSTATPMVQVCNMAGKQTFVMSVASKQLLETFRKLHS